MAKNKALSVTVTGGELVIRIGVDTLKWAAEHHEDFWLPSTDKYTVAVSAPVKFAREVVKELRREEEDGSTLVHLMLDKAIAEAVEQGAEGLDLDAMDAAEAAESAHTKNPKDAT